MSRCQHHLHIKVSCKMFANGFVYLMYLREIIFSGFKIHFKCCHLLKSSRHHKDFVYYFYYSCDRNFSSTLLFMSDAIVRLYNSFSMEFNTFDENVFFLLDTNKSCNQIEESGQKWMGMKIELDLSYLPIFYITTAFMLFDSRTNHKKE